MILESIFQDQRDLAEEWRAEAARRRKLWAEDPTATFLAYCAAELEERVRRQELRVAQLTVREFASLHRKSEPTIRRWINQGRIKATWTSEGWSIARTEEPAPAGKKHREPVAA